MIIQQNETKTRCEKHSANNNNNKNKNNNLNNNKRTSRQEEPTPINNTSNSSASNKKFKSGSSNNTYKDDTNDNHLYDYTYSLLQNNDILKIGTHNVQSFHNKVKQQQIINTIENLKLDIFGISETNLTEKHIKHVTRSLDKSYDYFFSAGERRLGSGVGIIINKSISQHIFHSFGYKGRFIYIDLQMKNRTKLRIFQIYLQTSNYDIKERLIIQKYLIEHIQTALNNNFRIIVMGDFNVNPDKPKNETKYKRQYQIIQNLKNLCFFDLFDTIYDINEHSPHNTWFNHSGSLESRIDMIWCSNNLINGLISCDSVCAESYTSDHKILISFFDKAELFGNKSTSSLKRQRIFKTKFSYDEMDNEKWTVFGAETDKLLNKEPSKNKYNEQYNFKTTDLNHLWQIIRTAIISAAKEHIPNHKSYAQDKRFMPYALSVIYNSIKKINKIYHKFHNSRITSNLLPSDEEWLKYKSYIQEVISDEDLSPCALPHSITSTNVKHIKNRIHSLLQTLITKAKVTQRHEDHEQMKRYINKRCKDFSDNPKIMISSLLERKKRIINLDRVMIQNAQNRQELLTDPEDVKTATIDHFQNIAGSTNHSVDINNPEWLKWKQDYKPIDDINSNFYDHLMDSPSNSEWYNVIHQLPNNKASSISGISNEMLNHIGQSTFHYLWLLVCACLKLNDISQQWKQAYVYPIPKPKEWRYELVNTRPITLLDTVRKALVKLVNNRLMN